MHFHLSYFDHSTFLPSQHCLGVVSTCNRMVATESGTCPSSCYVEEVQGRPRLNPRPCTKLKKWGLLVWKESLASREGFRSSLLLCIWVFVFLLSGTPSSTSTLFSEIFIGSLSILLLIACPCSGQIIRWHLGRIFCKKPIHSSFLRLD
jgi:hypothetical protein